MSIRTAAVVFLLMTLPGAARADALLQFVDTRTGKPQSRIAIGADKLRVDIAYAPGNAYTVLDLESRTVTQINPGQQATATAAVEQLQALAASLDGARDPATQPLLQMALDHLPDAQRQQAQALLQQSQREQNLPFTKTAQRDRVVGIACTIYEQRGPDGDPRRLCVAPYATLGLSAADTQTLQTAIGLLRDTHGPWLPAASVPGLPIRYSGSLGAGQYAGAGSLKSISHAALPASFFADPAGYRIVSIFEMLSMSGLAP
ncbi:hypothetical protein [Solimonas marina]|uniref:DUF4412 domain-containing protein n=1 Tax=Solimonas marina TaxID=2714601 RepID=A0A969WBU5_9GAMM|nr:hypothetical protein [Solimonas marina]NKF23683.1 hypothetical protein [Solimonas marina]